MVVISRSMRCSLVLTMLMLLAVSPLFSTERMGDDIPIIGGGMLSVRGQGALSETTITESIVIDGDEEYRAFIEENGLPGEGTAGSPIIWDGVSFHIGESISGLEFNDTTLYTSIINCDFSMETSGTINYYLSGIIIQGSSNISIRGCEFINIDHPIYFLRSIDCEVSDCTFDGGVGQLISSDSERITIKDNSLIYGGIQLTGTGNSTISGNTISASGEHIYLEKCNNCTLDGNLVEWSFYSIWIRYSSDITLMDNKNPLGLLIIQGDTDDFKTLELIGNNTSLGKELLFFRDKVFNGSWEYPLGQHVYFVNCSDLRITQPDRKGEDYGMLLKVVGCENITLEDCIIWDEYYEFISIQDTHLLSIEGVNLTQYSGLILKGCEDFRIIDSHLEGWPSISGSSNGFVFNNTISLGDLQVLDSREIVLEDNYFIGADLKVSEECSDIHILSNRFLQYSELNIGGGSGDVTIDSNILDQNSSIHISAPLEDLRTFNVRNNTVAGEPFTFLIDEDFGGMTWEDSAGQIFLAGVSNLVFRNQSITSNWDQMTLIKCQDIKIYDTDFLGVKTDTIPDESWNQPGIILTSCERVKFEGNEVIQSKIEIGQCVNIDFKDNTFETTFAFHKAIVMYNSEDLRLKQNHFNTSTALELGGCTKVQISENMIESRNGIIIRASSEVTLENNNLSGLGTGLDIRDCELLVISGNQLHGFGKAISMAWSNNDSIQNNHILGHRTEVEIRNWIDGTFINNVIESEKFQGITFSDSSNITIRGVTVINPNKAGWVKGITLFRSKWCNLIGCTFPENTFEGIRLVQCNDFLIYENTFFRNQRGLRLSNSNGNMIFDNLFEWNQDVAIEILEEPHYWGPPISSNNTIWNNTFYKNGGSQEVYNEKHYQVIDDGSNNTWYSVEGYGNRWSDWTSPNYNGDNIVDEPYPIHGSAGSMDLYPITDVIDVKIDWMKERNRSSLGFYFIPLHFLIISLALFFLVNSIRPYKIPKDKVKGKSKGKAISKKVRSKISTKR